MKVHQWVFSAITFYILRLFKCNKKKVLKPIKAHFAEYAL